MPVSSASREPLGNVVRYTSCVICWIERFKKHPAALYSATRAVWDLGVGRVEAEDRLNELVAAWEEQFPDVAIWLDENGRETLAALDFPRDHQRHLRTTDGLERQMQELKRRSQVIRIFPTLRSCHRLSTVLVKEQHED